MIAFLAQRFGTGLIIIVSIVVLTFALIRVSGDPIAMLVAWLFRSSAAMNSVTPSIRRRSGLYLQTIHRLPRLPAARMLPTRLTVAALM